MNDTPAKFATKVAKTAATAAASLSGDEGIFRRLKVEHAEIEALMNRVALSSDGATRRQLFNEIHDKLVSHARGEETAFYPLVLDFPATLRRGEQAQREHHEFARKLAELESMDPGSEQWMIDFRELQGAVHKHIEEEETEIFPTLQELFERRDAEDIEKQYAASKHPVGDYSV